MSLVWATHAVAGNPMACADSAPRVLATLARRVRQLTCSLCAAVGGPDAAAKDDVAGGLNSGVSADPAQEASDEALMAAYRGGDSTAFEKIFRRYAERIYSVMLKHGMTPDDASDIVQQTFTRMHQARNDFRPDATLRPWLWTIAYNLMRDSMRRRSTRYRAEKGLVQQQQSASEVDRGGLDPEMRRALGKALGALSESQREVLVLHYYEGLSFAEIASIIAVKEGAVRVRAHRAYRRLRELLGNEQEARSAL